MAPRRTQITQSAAGKTTRDDASALRRADPPVSRATSAQAPPPAVAPRGRPPTIHDVAAAAGVSKSTVSNVVRGADEVSAPTRDRVLAAIARLNYKPNGIARQFVKQRTTTLGVLVGDLSNPYYAQMAQVVERAAFGRGYTTMFCNIEDDEDELGAGGDELAVSGVEALLEQRVAGVVLLAFIARTDQLDRALRRAGIPIVFLGLSARWGDSVGPRDRQGGELATQHLLSLGHRRIGYVCTPLVEASGDRARRDGYRGALRRAGVPAPAPWHWTPGSPRITLGGRRRELAQALDDPQAPTALFVSNDIGAISLIEACESRGRRVPDDLSIVGFDDIALAGLHRISLTTVAQPLDFQAQRAVALLLERIDRPWISPRHESVPVELRVRGSTAAPAR